MRESGQERSKREKRGKVERSRCRTCSPNLHFHYFIATETSSTHKAQHHRLIRLPTDCSCIGMQQCCMQQSCQERHSRRHDWTSWYLEFSPLRDGRKLSNIVWSVFPFIMWKDISSSMRSAEVTIMIYYYFSIFAADRARQGPGLKPHLPA